VGLQHLLAAVFDLINIFFDNYSLTMLSPSVELPPENPIAGF
jgi:hypothetical protein